MRIQASRKMYQVLGASLMGLTCLAFAQESEPTTAAVGEQSADEIDFLQSLTQEPLVQSAPSPEPSSTEAAASATESESPPSEGQQQPEALDVISLPAKQAPSQALSETSRPKSQLEEIVVTATKRAELPREIPATINVLSGADLERQGVQSIDEIVSQVPGVNLSDQGIGTAKRITIRGVSGDDTVNFTTGTLFGDVPFSDPFIPKVQLDPNPFDMATVEILKGPQGTLFGGSGLNGMIRYVPQEPQFDAVHLKYFTQYTSYPGNGGSGWSYGAVINAPFAGNSAAIRLMGFHRDAPGYVDDIGAGKADANSMSQYGFRAMLAWHPDENWKISLLGTTQHVKSEDIAFTDNHDGDLQRSNTPRLSPMESTYTLGSLGIERSFEWGDLVSLTSYFKKEYDVFLDISRTVPDNKIPLLAAVDTNHSNGFSQELRAVSATGDSPWKWLLGAFYYDMKLYDCAEVGALEGLPSLPPIELLEGLLASPCPGNVGKFNGALDVAQLLGEIKVKEMALFGELTRELGESWEATLGTRAYRTKSGGTVSSAGLLYSAQTGGFPASHDATVTEQGLSPKASIVYHPTETFRMYITAARGFRFGGPQLGASTPLTQVPPIYKSDSLWSYELGLRTDWFDNSLRFDASVYHLDWKNPQISQITKDNLSSFIDNVGGAKGNGVDLTLRYLPEFLEGLSLTENLAWNRLVTSEPFTSASGNAVPVGSPWPLSPKVQTSTTLAYTQPVASWALGGSVRHAYMGQACNAIDCTARVFGYHTLDLNLFANPMEGSYWPQFSLSLSNLTDKRGFVNITKSELLPDSITYLAPRTLILRLSGSF